MHVEVRPNVGGPSARTDVAAAPNMEVSAALFAAETEYDSGIPDSIINNPFAIKLTVDKRRRCYVISAVSDLSSNAHAQWMVKVADSKRKVSV